MHDNYTAEMLMHVQ